MKTINIETLTAFINQHSLSSSFEAFLKEWKGSSQLNFKGFGLERIVKLSQKINENHGSKIEGNSGEGKGQLLEWKKGEYKIFVWLLAFYCFVHHLEVEQLSQKDYEFFTSVLLRLDSLQLQFQVLCLFSQKSNLKHTWRAEESRLLEKIITSKDNIDTKLEWKGIAFELFCLSGKEFMRNGPCVRERWANHLDPRVKKGHWTTQEDFLLMSKVQEEGQKWCEISKFFQGERTQHMVKNRYHSLLQKQQKDGRRLSPKLAEEKLMKELEEILSINQEIYPQEKILQKERKNQPIPEVEAQKDVYFKVEEEEMSLESLPALNSQEISEELEIGNVLCENYQESWDKCLDLDVDFFEMGLNYGKNSSVRTIIDDVADILGYSHPQQVDLFFQFREPEEFLMEQL